VKQQPVDFSTNNDGSNQLPAEIIRYYSEKSAIKKSADLQKQLDKSEHHQSFGKGKGVRHESPFHVAEDAGRWVLSDNSAANLLSVKQPLRMWKWGR
jgi:hypothetical protein